MAVVAVDRSGGVAAAAAEGEGAGVAADWAAATESEELAEGAGGWGWCVTWLFVLAVAGTGLLQVKSFLQSVSLLASLGLTLRRTGE